MSRALHAEWTKLRTAPSTAWLPLAAVVMTVGLSTAISAAATPGTISCADGCDTARIGLSGIYLGQTAIVALAVLAVTGEYSSGLIITSLTASRILLLDSGFTVARGYRPLSVTHGPTLRAAAGTVLYLGLVALLSLGVAVALRHTVRALTSVLGLLYLVPILGQTVADERWHTWIETYAPMTAGLAVQATTELDSLPIQPWAGLGVLAAYACTVLILGATAFITRDV